MTFDSAVIMRCPDREALLSFTLGKLSSPASVAIAEHIGICPWCESVLQDLDKHTHQDAVVSNIRACFAAQPLQEPGWAHLEAAAKALSITAGPSPRTEGMREPDRAITWVGRHIGNYQIVDVLGRGGMGVVFKARQLPLNRLVALKMIQSGPLAGPSARHRFRTEGEAIARLQHPNVIQIHDFGDVEGLPYFSMEYLEGGSLSARLAQSPLTPRQAAEMLVMLADAVNYVHACQVVHRDLKPANILLTDAGIPKISDFGLAKLLDLDGDHTRSEHILGTPSYMAPEQARGGTDGTGPGVDIYALGVVLYEALTGHRPFSGSSKAEILDQVCNKDPPRPSRYRPDLPRDLEAVCLKCLEKDPRKRYATGRALGDDLQRWLQGEPTQARPRRWPHKVWCAVKRHPRALALGALLPCLLAALWLTVPVNHLPEIDAQVAASQPVALIGASGRPRWLHLVTGGDRTQTSLADDGSFGVHSWGFCLLELLPDTRHESYKITAQVRHLKSDQRGEVGFYVARQAHAGRHDYQYFVHMAYNDVRSIAELFGSLPPDRAKKLNNQGNSVGLMPHLYADRDSTFPLDQSQGVRGAVFKPSGFKGGPWRDLEISVTPEKIVGSWDSSVVGTLPAAQVAREFDKFQTFARKTIPDDPLLVSMSPEYKPRGGIGLYVQQSSAFFRNVTFTPEPSRSQLP